MLKKLIYKIDALVLGGAIRACRLWLKERKILAKQSRDIKHSIRVFYAKNDHSLLNTLADKYGTDKGEVNSVGNPYPWQSHSYTDFYDLMFGLCRASVGLVVECGLGTNNPDVDSSMGVSGKPGASLRMWRDYFPQAQVIGCDIDAGVLFEEERIRTYQCDQTDPASVEKFVKTAGLKTASADIIIDDGLHKFHAGKCFFENMIGVLKADGIYVIEDVNPNDLPKYQGYFADKEALFEVRFVHLYDPKRTYAGDNRLIVIRKKASA